MIFGVFGNRHGRKRATDLNFGDRMRFTKKNSNCFVNGWGFIIQKQRKNYTVMTLPGTTAHAGNERVQRKLQITAGLAARFIIANQDAIARLLSHGATLPGTEVHNADPRVKNGLSITTGQLTRYIIQNQEAIGRVLCTNEDSLPGTKEHEADVRVKKRNNISAGLMARFTTLNQDELVRRVQHRLGLSNVCLSTLPGTSAYRGNERVKRGIKIGVGLVTRLLLANQESMARLLAHPNSHTEWPNASAELLAATNPPSCCVIL